MNQLCDTSAITDIVTISGKHCTEYPGQIQLDRQVNECFADDANYGYAMLSLMTSSLIICACVVLFVAYVYCSISCKGAARGSLSSRA